MVISPSAQAWRDRGLRFTSIRLTALTLHHVRQVAVVTRSMASALALLAGLSPVDIMYLPRRFGGLPAISFASGHRRQVFFLQKKRRFMSNRLAITAFRSDIEVKQSEEMAAIIIEVANLPLDVKPFSFGMLSHPNCLSPIATPSGLNGSDL